MQTSRFISRALAAVKARPWPWLGGAAAVVLGVGVALSLTIEPRLAPVPQTVTINAPYRSDVDARVAVEQAQARAAASGKLLMVMFGANWCPDCLTLWGNLRQSDCRSYVEKHVEIVSIDVGDEEKSAAVKRDLGIEVNVIPLAVFYSPSGERLGDTLRGELKPSRHFNSRQIRDFLREVVDYHRIVSPDQRQ
jgi:thiol-disulfide isomerase/thioredoxin